MKRSIDAPVDVVWDWLTTTSRWPSWGLSISDHEGPARIGLGSKGRVATIVGISLPYVVDEYVSDTDEDVSDIDLTAIPTPGSPTLGSFVATRRWSWRVAGVKATSHEVTARSAVETDVVFGIPAWAFVYVPVVWWSLRALEQQMPQRRGPGS